jgi:hypothetical protein
VNTRSGSRKRSADLAIAVVEAARCQAEEKEVKRRYAIAGMILTLPSQR